jgi:uncharacterized protein Smg (DUF494 family)
MYERIIEIIVFVIAELRHNKNIDEIDLEELQSRGYTSSEISTAFSWIVDRYELSEKYVVNEEYSNADSFRILHEVEKDLFTTEAWGELLQYHSLGILKNDHIEMLIERALMLGLQEVDSHQLKQFIANIIFNAQFNQFPGSRFMLKGTDSIN